jgi:hypothetical protein
MGNSVIFIRDGLVAPVSGGGNSRFPLASADDFNAAMIDCYKLFLSVLIEYVVVGCYNLCG